MKHNLLSRRRFVQGASAFAGVTALSPAAFAKAQKSLKLLAETMVTLKGSKKSSIIRAFKDEKDQFFTCVYSGEGKQLFAYKVVKDFPELKDITFTLKENDGKTYTLAQDGNWLASDLPGLSISEPTATGRGWMANALDSLLNFGAGILSAVGWLLTGQKVWVAFRTGNGGARNVAFNATKGRIDVVQLDGKPCFEPLPIPDDVFVF